jgi:hypothetical protein
MASGWEWKTEGPGMETSQGQPTAAPSSEPPAIKVLILCSVPIIAWAPEKCLEGGPRTIQTHRVAYLDDSDGIGNFGPQVVIAVPQTWEEMSRLLPQVDRRFSSAMWLVYSRLRVAGMFSEALAGRFCSIVSWSATPAEFRASFWGLLRCDPDCPPASLLALINRRLWAARRVPRPAELTARQLQCGCVSFSRLLPPTVHRQNGRPPVDAGSPCPQDGFIGGKLWCRALNER